MNIRISDLFFNTDVSHTKRYDKKGRFAGFNSDSLLEEAGILLDHLEALGIKRAELPTRAELVHDFLARV